jgi:hypothetical protein
MTPTDLDEVAALRAQLAEIGNQYAEACNDLFTIEQIAQGLADELRLAREDWETDLEHDRPSPALAAFDAYQKRER